MTKALSERSGTKQKLTCDGTAQERCVAAVVNGLGGGFRYRIATDNALLASSRAISAGKGYPIPKPLAAAK